jgi:hypothetical protein
VTDFVRRGAVLLLLASVSCASAPRPTRESLRIRANAPAVIEGRVRDPEGRAVAGISVRGIPRGESVPWSAAAVTGCDGGFRLTVAAPASYGFELAWRGTSVITSRPEDPARLDVPVIPGEVRSGADLVFLSAEWRAITESAPERIPSCP